MCFMMHGDKLYGWDGCEQPELIADNASNLYYMSDDQFFYMTTRPLTIQNKEVEHSEIYMVEC